MKKFLILIIALSAGYLSETAQALTTKNIQLTFNSSDFTLETEDGLTYIDSSVHDVFFTSDTLSPALPHITVNILIEQSQIYNSHTIQKTYQLLGSNIIIAPNASEIIDTITYNIPEPTNIYYTGSFPTTNVDFVGEEMIDGAKLLVFDVCPFIYNSTTHQLYIISSLNISIVLDETNNRSGSTNSLNNMYSIVYDMIENPEDLSTGAYHAPLIGNNTPINTEGYEYIIVTTESMKSTFQQLANWKTQKGIKAKVITIEDIDLLYPQYSSRELRIKYALKDYYNGQYHNLRYAVLAGSQSNVPSPNCYVRFFTHHEYTPTDWFYACFDTMDWDSNNNNKWGEIDDGVDLYPEIFVTRLPARNANEAQIMIDKIIGYESNPTNTEWNNQILMGGAKLRKKKGNTSDSEYRSGKIYDKYILPYWNGNRVKFFDTGTSFPGGSDYQFTAYHLRNVLSQGYPFVHIYTHGNWDRWKMEEGDGFKNSDVQYLNNPIYTIITANSCYTNQFDNPNQTCLGEYFMNKSNSGVVGVWGCSRAEYSCVIYKKLSSANEFVGDFYKCLFSNENNNKNFGFATCMAKIQNLGRCKHPTIYSTRHALYIFNAFGDSEMPVYIQVPQHFTNPDIELLNNQLSVSTEIEGCSICVMSKNDCGEQYYCVVRGTSDYTFDLSNTQAIEYVVTITKPGYVAYSTEVQMPNENNVYIQNQTFTSNATIVGDNIYIGRDVDLTQQTGDVIVNNGTLNVQGNNKVVIKNGFKVNLGANLKIN